MDKKELVVLGACTKPHGIKGGFAFMLDNVEDSVLKNGKSIYLFPKTSSSSLKNSGEVFNIDKISFGNKVIVYLKGISDRNIVEAMLPFDIKFPRDEFPEPDEDEFYIADLIGCDVLEDETDKSIGKVAKYYDNGMQIILTIRTQSESFDIPFVDHFVTNMDLEDGKIWIVVPRIV